MQSKAFNMDCMEAMKQFPDKYFDLAVVDPPYGDGIDTSGEAADTHTHTARPKYNRFGERFDRYKTERSPSQQLPQERERERTRTRSHLVCGLRKGDSQPDWWNMGGEVRKKNH